MLLPDLQISHGMAAPPEVNATEPLCEWETGEHDRFHVITEHPRGGLPFDRDYFGIHRTDNCIFFQITLNSGRSVELKQNFYKALADRLNEGLKLRREDVLINLIEVPKENWSFGNGVAQYIPSSH